MRTMTWTTWFAVTLIALVPACGQGAGGNDDDDTVEPDASAAADVDAAPPSPLTGPPLTFDDPRFADTSPSSPLTLVDGAALDDASITETGDIASILCEGTCALDRVRVSSREALRIVTGTIRAVDTYLEATGEGDDHADVIQAYSPGSTGSLILRTTSVVSHETAATAGIFIADNWGPDLIDLENVMIKGGPYGVRLHADGYANAHVRMKDVCFVGPFAYGALLIDGEWTVDEWTNVNHCTIVDGQLVRGDAISPP